MSKVDYDRYLRIFQDNPYGGLERYTDLWKKFIDAGHRSAGVTARDSARERIKEYNGIWINDIVMFASEADKAWFILRWS